MKIDVYEPYARSKTGKVMHFDVFVKTGTTEDKAFEYGRKWLTEIGESADNLTQSNCNFCHSEMANPVVQKTIQQDGYFILEMENCPHPIR